MTDHPPRFDPRDYPARMRPFVDLLCMWRLCARPACRRARACRGDARVCFLRNVHLLPDGVQDWYDGVCDAQQQRKPFDEALEELNASDAGAAFRDWYGAVSLSLGEEKADLPWRWWEAK